ncbi:hypothetical protein BDF14DRAFT_1769919 [Spinellus fusiger]|nr:hypothetical protein BDF14DRAFT_1769919 [Spinellus fusiger]
MLVSMEANNNSSHRRTHKLKKMFSHPPAHIMPTLQRKNNAPPLPISSPILHHTSSLYSLVSPVRSHFEGHSHSLEHTHSHSPISVHGLPEASLFPKKLNSISPAPRTSSTPQSHGSIPTAPSRTPRVAKQPTTHASHTSPKVVVNDYEEYDDTADTFDESAYQNKYEQRSSLRRHSCSSTDLLRQHLQPPSTTPSSNQRHHHTMANNHSSGTMASNSSHSYTMRSSTSSSTMSTMSTTSTMSTRSTMSTMSTMTVVEDVLPAFTSSDYLVSEANRNSCSSFSSSSLSAAAAAAALPTPGRGYPGSKSTPLRKIKTYNVQPYDSPIKEVESPKTWQEKEKDRRQQILEDLISGRRASTLKFTLTPKGLA